MEKEIDLGLGRVRSVETDNVVVLVLYPDTAEKADGFFVCSGLDVNDEAADLSQEFTPHEVEFVVLLLEIGIQDDHLSEAQRQKVQGIDSGQLGQHAMSE